MTRAPVGRSIVLVLIVWAATRGALLMVATASFIHGSRPVPFIRMWIEWDANFYLSIVDHGYMLPVVVTGHETGQSNLNFFPVMPIAAALVRQLPISTACAGLIAANLILIAAGIALHRMALARVGSAGATWSVVSLFALPGSFILSAPMSEPPFLALSIASVLLASRQRFGAASFAAAILAITRVTGLLVGVVLVVDWAADRARGLRRSFGELLVFSLIPIPLLLFFAFMRHLTGDPLAPLHSQQAFWDQTFSAPFQNLVMFAWAHQPRLRLDGAIAFIMVLVLISAPRLFSIGEWVFIAVSVLSFSSSESAAPSVVRYMIGLYPLHLAFGHLCARHRLGRALMAALALGNLILMIPWSHGSDILI